MHVNSCTTTSYNEHLLSLLSLSLGFFSCWEFDGKAAFLTIHGDPSRVILILPLWLTCLIISHPFTSLVPRISVKPSEVHSSPLTPPLGFFFLLSSSQHHTHTNTPSSQLTHADRHRHWWLFMRMTEYGFYLFVNDKRSHILASLDTHTQLALSSSFREGVRSFSLLIENCLPIDHHHFVYKANLSLSHHRPHHHH